MRDQYSTDLTQVDPNLPFRYIVRDQYSTDLTQEDPNLPFRYIVRDQYSTDLTQEARPIDLADYYTARNRKRELEHTAQESIFPERSRSCKWE